jgi:hypothetical protein
LAGVDGALVALPPLRVPRDAGAVSAEQADATQPKTNNQMLECDQFTHDSRSTLQTPARVVVYPVSVNIARQIGSRYL